MIEHGVQESTDVSTMCGAISVSDRLDERRKAQDFASPCVRRVMRDNEKESRLQPPWVLPLL